jgi:two-component system chemotaxis response regulator CheY
MKVLVVDDNEQFREILHEMLKGWEIIEAENGLEAVQLYTESKPDIVLMDIRMPVMDGIEATKIIKTKSPKAKIIGITGFAASLGEAMIKAGALEVLSKPIRIKMIREKMQFYLSGKATKT